jgi:hypothetical protein
MNKALKIIGKTVAAVAALLFFIWLLLQTPRMQTFIGKKITGQLEKNINGAISFSKIHFRPFKALVLKDVVVLDNDPAITYAGEMLDTVVHARSLYASFSLKGLLKKEGLLIHKATLSDAAFTLTKEERGSNLSRVFGSSSGKSSSSRMTTSLEKLSISNFRFRIINPETCGEPGSVKPSGMVDMNDLDVVITDAKAKNLSLADGKFTGEISELEAREKSGMRITTCSLKATASKESIAIEGLNLSDGFTKVVVPDLSISMQQSPSSAEDSLEAGNFLQNAGLNATVSGTRIDSRTLSRFIPAMQGKNISILLDKAVMAGTLDDMNIDRLSFAEERSGISGKLRGNATGLPSIDETSIDVIVEDFRFSSDGVGKLLAGFVPAGKLNLEKYAPGEILTLKGRAHGRLNDLSVKGELLSGIGSATADFKLRNMIAKESVKHISGSMNMDALNLGRLAGMSQLGECTARGGVSADFEADGPRIKMDSVIIDRMKLLEYEYSNIRATGTFSDNAFDGRVVCNDPNLNFLFQGIFTLSDETRNGLYKFYANVGYADLNALHLDKRGVSKVSGQINANYMSIKHSDLIGDLDVKNLNLENDLGSYNIGDICLKSHSNDKIHRINVTSGFLDGTFVGSTPITSIFRDIQDLTTRRDLPSLYKQVSSKWKGDDYDISINVHDIRDVLSFVKPGLYIADSTRIKLKIAEDGEVQGSLKSPRLALGSNFLRNINLTVDNSEGSINGVARSSEIALSGFKLLNSTLSFFGDEDRFTMGCSYNNHTEEGSKGEIHLAGNLERDHNGTLIIHGMVLPSSIMFKGENWTIPSSKFELNGKDIAIDRIMAMSGEQAIKISGGFATTQKDTLAVDVSRFNLGILNSLSAKKLDIAGISDGKVLITSPWKTNSGVMMNLTTTGARFGGEELGTVRASSTLDNGKMHFILRSDLEQGNALNVVADYFTKEGRYDITARLNHFKAGCLRPVVSSVFSDIDGTVDGNVSLKGGKDGLKISSDGCRFNEAMIKIAYTQVPYFLNGPFSLTDKGIFFDDVTLHDRHKGVGRASGGILWENFKNIRMDTRIRIDNMEAIALGEHDNDNFYGNMAGSGAVLLSGPFSSLLLDIDLKASGGGNVHIPLDNSTGNSKNDLLTFKQDEKPVHVDPYEVMIKKIGKKKNSNDLKLKIVVDVDQNTEAFVELDRAAGNILSGRGAGIIDIDIRPSRNLFTINGDYTISQGNFHFNAMDIAKRNFTLSNGSSVHFNGDVMDSDLNISGLYSTKASIATLIADTTSVSSRRLVNCGIGITGKLREPQLAFSIDVPDLDPTTKSKVESALNTSDKVQKQFIALLISGSFMPDEQSGIVNNTNMIYTNMAEIMAGQLNNILQKLDIPLDFGLNYQSSESGTNIFDVAVSTQLFNNRVLVNGALGNREFGSSQSDDMVGDLDIEVKLDKAGQLRFNLFSHSADDYTNYLDNTQRNGLGFTFQKEFDNLKEFFSELFISKKKKERIREEMMKNAPDSLFRKEMKTITINEEK